MPFREPVEICVHMALSSIYIKALQSVIKKSWAFPMKFIIYLNTGLSVSNSQITDIVDELVNIWKRLLGQDHVETHENFFSLGGHSILAIELLNDIEEYFAVRLSMKDIVESPTIQELSLIISSLANTSQVVDEKIEIEDMTAFPLTSGQKQVWGHSLLNPGSLAHNISTAIRIKKNLNLGVINKTINYIVERQDVLRTRFITINGQPKQIIVPKQHYDIHFKDILENEILTVMQNEINYCFDLEKDALLRVSFYRLGEEDFIFFFMVHHIIWDGLSNTMFFHEFNHVYNAFLNNLSPELPPLKITFKEYSLREQAYLKTSLFKEQKHAWKELLYPPLPVLNLPTDYPRPEKFNNKSKTHYFEIDKDKLDKLETYVRSKHTSLYRLLFTLYNVLLSKHSGETDIIVGTPIHGRHSSDIRRTCGYFINTLPVRSRIEKSDSFISNLFGIQESLKNSFANQTVPFDIIVQNSNPIIDPGRTSLFQTLFVYLDITRELDVFEELNYEQIKADRSSTHTDIDFYLYKSRDKIEGVVEYRADLFKKETIENLIYSFNEIMDKVLKNDEAPIAEIINETSSPTYIEDKVAYDDFSEEKSFLSYFIEKSQQQPDAPAIYTNYNTLTYKELYQKAKIVAHCLREKNIGKGNLVAVSCNRNENLIISLLGVLMSGAGYVPLDPSLPDNRIQYMLERSNASALLIEKKLQSKLAFKINTFYIEETLLNYESVAALECPNLDDTCYVIFTSGSTGRPKGVEITHLNVLNFLLSMQKTPGFTSKDKLLSVTTFSFDISVLEFFLPLISGGSVYLASEEDVVDGERLLNLIKSEAITYMQATPSTWRLMLASGWHRIETLTVLCGGEAFTKELSDKLVTNSRASWNMYGPTETTVWSTIKKLELTDKKVLIGSPIANTSIYVLDDYLCPVPAGKTGNLYISGLGLAKGYIGDETQTSKRFISNPFRKNEKMYFTGDLARHEIDGQIECLGRSDDQVKIRGYRIELGEIEDVIMKSPVIYECSVKAHQQTGPSARLVAYLSIKPDSQFDEGALRQFLKETLPSYMLPAKYIVLPSLPKTHNGKIDKKQLKEELGNKKEFLHKASDQTTAVLINIWQEVLGVDDIDETSNFFTVGGHSIAAVEIFGIINDRFKINLPIATIFDATSIQELSYIIEKGIEENQPVALDLTSLKNIVAIKTHHKQSAVFCFHGVGGNVLNYYPLSGCVGEKAFYGVQSLGVNGTTYGPGTIPEMAKLYIEEIRKVQAKGPYILSGGSMGGLIALEVARQLRHEGEQIKSLIMFDTFGPDFDSMFIVKENKFSPRRLKQSFKDKFERLKHRVKCNYYSVINRPLPHALLYRNVERQNQLALYLYRPEIYQGDLILIRAPLQPKGFYADPYLGWRKCIEGNIEIIEVEGQHESFIESPSLAAAFQKVLTKI